MADGTQPSRLDRVAEAIAEGLRGFRKGETSVADLAGALRDGLGPNERLFIASAAATALDTGHKDKLGEALEQDTAREAAALDPRACTVRSYQLLIERYRSVGNEDKAVEFEQALERIRSGWSAEDAKTEAGRQA